MSHWRNSFRPARFFMLDARVSIVLLLAMLHIRTWTIVLATIIILAFYWVERIGLDFPGAIRAVRQYVAGKVRPPRKPDKITLPVDHDRRPLF